MHYVCGSSIMQSPFVDCRRWAAHYVLFWDDRGLYSHSTCRWNVSTFPGFIDTLP